MTRAPKDRRGSANAAGRSGRLSQPPAGRARRVKLRDVAEAAGVHYSTVSRVLRADPGLRVSKDVAERIRRVATELGYRPDVFAAGMHSKSLQSVGVIVHDITDPVYPPILRGIEEVLRERGLMTVIGNTGYDDAVEADMYEQMSRRMVDGLIFGTTRLEDRLVEAAVESGMPVSSVLRRTGNDICSAAVNDCAAGMRQLAGVVAERGFRNIGVIAAPQTLSTACERLEGIHAGLGDHGMELDPDKLEFVPRMNKEEGRRAFHRLMDRGGTRPEVVICVNDPVAVGALAAAGERGLRCPEDISITGYNDVPFVDMLNPPLATVRMDLPAIGRASAELLLEQIDAAPPARTTRLMPELVLRASLGWPHGTG